MLNEIAIGGNVFEFLIAICLLLLIGIYQNHWFVRKIVFIIKEGIPRYFLLVFRTSYSYPTLVIIILTAATLGAAIIKVAPERIVLVTLFYATVLFLGRIFQADRPYPTITLTQRYYDHEFVDQEGKQGFEYEFAFCNLGEANLVEPKIECKLYDGKYRVVHDWKPVQGTALTPTQIGPSEHSTSFTVRGGPISDSDKTDYYLSLRILPRRGNWILGKWWVEKIGEEKSSS